MQVILYKNASESNYLDKNLTPIVTLNITLKDTCSKVKPELILTNKYDCNYCYIPDFNRYYFVEEPKQLRNNLWSYSCKSDALSSFKQAIRENRAIILRTADNRYNDKLFDDSLVQASLKVDRHNQIIKFPNTDGFHINDSTISSELQLPFMLITNGPGGINI